MEEPVKKKRHRPKTRSIRISLKNKIESALLLQKSPILHLFKKSCGTDLAAPLNDVLDALDPAAKKLNKFQLRSISNKSRIFNIIGTDAEPLQLVFDSRNRENLEDKTVYVDNLPLSCSAEQLRRRASVYGTVVHVNLPVVKRLQRRHCIGVQSPLNSGFAFLQFSSKTAVRRFCKRYASNCHLNRTHHPKTHRKRKSHLSMSAAANTSSQPQPNTSSTQPVEADQPKQNPAPTTDSQEAQTRPSINILGGRRKRRSTEVSISGIDSGTESDFPKTDFKKIKLDESTADVKSTKTKRKKRKRKVPATAFSLTKYLNKLQVFPYSKYRELRKEYIQLKNNNFNALKTDLKERGLIHSEADVENIDFASRGDGQLPQPRRRKRQRSRRQPDAAGTSNQKPKHHSRSTVIKVATRLKNESFAVPYNAENSY
ncbi:RRM domain-containing protein [Aphelenchoides bicaudatus]|nr:RRM domain-containing protein [Aphelenchoides bicaudatus]